MIYEATWDSLMGFIKLIGVNERDRDFFLISVLTMRDN